MKKCPKCGTVLDDSKKTCYMCGAVLNVGAPLNFGETFNNQVGATVTKGQDNVFNNMESIKPGDNNNFQSNGSNNLFKDQFDSLNSIHYDERTALEKIFSDDSRFKSKDELNAMEEAAKNSGNNNGKGSKKNTYTTPTKMTDSGAYMQEVNNSGNKQNEIPSFINDIPNKMVAKNKAPNNNNLPMNNGPINNMPMNNNNGPMNNNGPTLGNGPINNNGLVNNMSVNNKQQANNSQINWGNNLKGDEKVKFHVSLTFIFNLISFVLFVGAMIFVYFGYFKPKQNETIKFGGLVYSLDDEFIMKKNDNFSRSYTRGENCTISITYGSTNDVDGFIKRYFDEVKASYEEINGYSTSTQELKINGNSWQELNVLKLQENPSGVGGYSTSTMYKYVAIVYKGKYYDIRYANLDGDGTCSANYDTFINSLAFEESK